MIIKVDFDYDADYMYCPDEIKLDIEGLFNQFKEWIDNEENTHPFWTDDTHIALCYRADAFAYWLNTYAFKGQQHQAKILETMTKEDKAYDYTLVL